MSAASPRNAIANFFIARPVFAIVLAIATMLAGVMGINSLSISQYPDIAPVTVRISATYSGATADAVENSVTRKIEGAMTGLDGLLYMESTSSTGSSSISLTFATAPTRSSPRSRCRTSCRRWNPNCRNRCRAGACASTVPPPAS